MNEHEEQRVRILEMLQGFPTVKLEILEHVLKCPECKQSLLEGMAEADLPVNEEPAAQARAYGPLLRQLESQCPGILQVLKERAERAWELFERLHEIAPEERPAALRTRAFRSLPLAHLLVMESQRVQPVHPERSEELARLALTAADHLHTAAQADVVRELRVRASILIGNARRLLWDWDGAEAHLRAAFEDLSGPPDCAERALYLKVRGLLRLDLGFLDEGMALLKRAADLYGDCCDERELGFCLAELAFHHLEEANVKRAEPLLLQACVALDRRTQAALWVRARLSLALCHAMAGRRDRALQLLERTRPWFVRVEHAAEMRLIVWLEQWIEVFTEES